MTRTRDVVMTAVLSSMITTVVTYFGVDYLKRRPWAKGPALVDVPVVVGMSRAEAELVLRQRGLRLSVVDTKPNKVFPKGIISRQTPLRGERVPKGSVVAVVVSAGSTKVKVPPVIGKSLEQAVAALATAGLKPGPVTRKPSETVAANLVLLTVPAPGQEVDKGTAVALTVSQGPELVEVPRVTGRYYRSAKKAITKAGLTVGKVHWTDDEDYDEYMVLRQNPKAGEKVPKGTAVDLTVNTGD